MPSEIAATSNVGIVLPLYMGELYRRTFMHTKILLIYMYAPNFYICMYISSTENVYLYRVGVRWNFNWRYFRWKEGVKFYIGGKKNMMGLLKQELPLIHELTATTPPPDPTPAWPSPSNPHTLTAHTHATQITVHASQSPQQPHAQHRELRQHHKQTKDYHRTTTGLLTPHKHTGPAVKVREISSYCKST